MGIRQFQAMGLLGNKCVGLFPPYYAVKESGKTVICSSCHIISSFCTVQLRNMSGTRGLGLSLSSYGWFACFRLALPLFFF